MEIQRLKWDDPRVASYISRSQPIVLTHCPLATPAANKWTTEYLNTIISKTFKLNVYVSDSLRFRYWDESKNTAGYSVQGLMTKKDMVFTEFLEKFNNANSNISCNNDDVNVKNNSTSNKKNTNKNNSSSENTNSGNSSSSTMVTKASLHVDAPSQKYYYLQQAVVVDMGQDMMNEYMK